MKSIYFHMRTNPCSWPDWSRGANCICWIWGFDAHYLHQLLVPLTGKKFQHISTCCCLYLECCSWFLMKVQNIVLSSFYSLLTLPPLLLYAQHNVSRFIWKENHFVFIININFLSAKNTSWILASSCYDVTITTQCENLFSMRMLAVDCPSLRFWMGVK